MNSVNNQERKSVAKLIAIYLAKQPAVLPEKSAKFCVIHDQTKNSFIDEPHGGLIRQMKAVIANEMSGIGSKVENSVTLFYPLENF